MMIFRQHVIPIIITCILQGTLCNTGIPRTFYGGKICSVLLKYFGSKIYINTYICDFFFISPAGLLRLFALFMLVSVSTTKGEDVVTEMEELEGRDGKGIFCSTSKISY